MARPFISDPAHVLNLEVKERTRRVYWLEVSCSCGVWSDTRHLVTNRIPLQIRIYFEDFHRWHEELEESLSREQLGTMSHSIMEEYSE